MKKFVSVFTGLLFVLTILYPVGFLTANCFDCSFKLTSILAFAIAIAILSVLMVICDLVCKNTLENKTIQILMAVIAPLSFINAIFYILECPKILVVISVLISLGCGGYFTVKYGNPWWLKLISLLLSALMILPFSYFSFIALIFGNFGQNTVVQTVESPSGRYYAQIIDSDQGALGGDTFVDVYQSGLDVIIFKIEKQPQRVYSGGWDEFESMQIYWEDDGCLVINSVAYRID